MSLLSTSLMPGSSSAWDERFAAWCQEGEQLCADAGGDPKALLKVLRELEQMHRGLQEGAFRASLPSSRQQLYALLQSMEQSGGWPYIPRLQLKRLLDNLKTTGAQPVTGGSNPA
jgi:hypothetical protein